MKRDALRTRTTVSAVALVAMLTGMLMQATPAGAISPGSNGRIAFGRFNDDLGDFQIFTANPDGSHEAQLIPGAAECPTWSPDGNTLLICIGNSNGLLRPARISPDGSGLTLLDTPDATLNLGCGAWSPDAARLLCEAWDDSFPNRTGVYTVRASDGGDLRHLTSNPFGGHDIPGDYSPDGKHIVFERERPGRQDSFALFVSDVDGAALRQLTPYSLAGCCSSRWSPDGSDIVFTSAQGLLFLVGGDGSHLRSIATSTQSRDFAFAPSWSPDGRKIILSIFVRATHQVDLYTVDRDGKNLVRVTDTAEEEDLANWGTHPLAQ